MTLLNSILTALGQTIFVISLLIVVCVTIAVIAPEHPIATLARMLLAGVEGTGAARAVVAFWGTVSALASGAMTSLIDWLGRAGRAVKSSLLAWLEWFARTFGIPAVGSMGVLSVASGGIVFLSKGDPNTEWTLTIGTVFLTCLLIRFGMLRLSEIMGSRY